MKKIWLLSLVLVTIMACAKPAGDIKYDTNMSVPSGDPAFPPLENSWVIDKAEELSKETEAYGDAVFEKLKVDGIAEIVLLTQFGVKHPEDYATHYGRWLGLGRKGPGTQGGDNGLVWLIRPDADLKMTISVGRGLPKFTSSDYGPIMEEAADYFNFNNFDAGVKVIVDETNKTLRQIYDKSKGEEG